ncbi:MAG TPA: hypothetical protein VGC85_07375 [Chthoniobacterales bacterium]
MNDFALAFFTRWQTRALIIGAVATIISLVGLFINRAQFFHSYLFAWIFWSGIAFGALVTVMMHALTGGDWGRAVHNVSIAAFRTLPLMALLFIPILLGLRDIFPWARGDNGEVPGYHHKAEYLNAPFFTVRAVVYFAVVIVFAIFWRNSAIRGERDKVAAISAGGLIAYVLCMNFASTDWVMSLDPVWYSTVFVEIFASGHFLSALAFTTALVAWLARNDDSLGAAIPRNAFYGLGNLLLSFVIFWTYVSFSQLLIIWSGNLPKEISWYLERRSGGWQWLAVVLFAVQFLIPFLLLLSRSAKEHAQKLFWIALLIFLANLVADFWQIAPSFHPDHFYLHWLDITLPIALGGIWVACFFHYAKEQPVLPNEWLEAKQNG